jgi:transposase-like protein
MCHRIREAMRDGSFSPLGGSGKIVEADETYYGPTAEPQAPSKQRKGRPFTKGGHTGPRNKRAIIALVERGGNVRTFHVPTADKVTVTKIVTENIARESRLHTDESRLYFGADAHFAAHKTVHHTSKEYARKDYTFDENEETVTVETVHTNSAEGYFSIFKRGMRGIYQHCGEKHLHRYLAEFDFRYNNRTALGHSDIDRTKTAIRAVAGKRLTYRQPH